MNYFIVLLSVAIGGCSAFVDREQSISLTGRVGKTQRVFANNSEVSVPGVFRLQRGHSLTIVVREKDTIVDTRTYAPVQSIWGKLDSWGVYFLYPGIGLFTPGSMQLETDTVHLGQ